MNKVKTLFIGTGDFAVPLLNSSLKSEFLEVIGVITQPDKPVGRKQTLTPGPVKQFLLDNNTEIKILQPGSIRKEGEELIQKFQPELILVASYGQIIPNSLLEFPKYGALNFHGSILPNLRGATPVPMAILLDLKTTGVTLQVMSEKMDEGPVISVRSMELVGNETSESLMKELSLLAIEILKEDLPKYLNGEIIPIKQDHSVATYCYKEDIAKEKAEIKFETDIELAERMTRAFYPWPVTWVKLSNGKILKIFKANIFEIHLKKGQGELEIVRNGDSLLLQLQNGVLELKEVQLEGKKRDLAQNYLYLGV